MLRKKILLVICFFAIIKSVAIYAGLFSFLSDKPDWIDGSSKKYSEQSYLIGVGVAKNIDDARTQARAEIIKIFKVQIAQSAKAVEKEKSIKSGNANTNITGEIASSLETKTFTEGALEGVTIPETWFDEDKKTYYALAVLDKVKARMSLANRISEAEEKIQSQLTIAENASSSMEEIKALTQILNEWNTRSLLIEQKRIVDPISVPDLPSNPTYSEIIERRNNALRKIIFIVQHKEQKENDHSMEILKEKITKFGLQIEKEIPSVNNPSSMYIIIKYNIDTKLIDRGNKEWKFYNWNGTIEILEGKPEGKILAAISKDGQESHTSETSAKAKAVSVAEQTLSQALENWIKENILGK